MLIHCHSDVLAIMPSLAESLADLCKSGSEMQGYFMALSRHAVKEVPPEMHLAVAYTLIEDGGLEPCGWVATHLWDGRLCLQQFVAPEKRGRYLATALTAALFLNRGRPESLCVFAPETARIATRLGVADVRLFKRVEDGWVRSEWSADRHTAGGDDAR